MKDRRTFLKTLAAVAAAGSQVNRLQAQQRPAAAPPTSVTGIRKSCLINQLPRELPYAERFAMAKAAGFEAIEIALQKTHDVRERHRRQGGFLRQ